MAPSHEQRHVAAEADLVHALAGTNASVELRLAHRTRRLIHTAIFSLRHRRTLAKRSLALAIAAIIAFSIVLSPIIWNAIDHLVSEEHFGDIQTQMSLLLLFALAALLAALLSIGKTLERGRRG